MDLSGFFLPFVIGVASAFGLTLFTVTLITHEPSSGKGPKARGSTDKQGGRR